MIEKQEIVLYLTEVQRSAMRYLSQETSLSLSKIISETLENVEISSVKNIDIDQIKSSKANVILAIKVRVSTEAKKNFDEMPHKKLYLEMLPTLMDKLNRIIQN